MEDQQDRKPTLENFLAHVPLNQEMEDLAHQVAREDEEPAPAEVNAADPFDPLRPLDDADRKALLKMVQDAGWEVYQRIRLRACAEAERAATLLSQDNPLGNQRRIAEGWAYLSVMRDVLRTERGTVQAELDQLKPKKRSVPQ